MLVMFMIVVYTPLYRLATVRTTQNRTFLLEKAERFSCTYYCLSLFLARLGLLDILLIVHFHLRYYASMFS